VSPVPVLLSAKRIIDAPYMLWLLLALPGVYWVVAYQQETMFYGELIHASGDLALQLLIVTLAITPLGLWFPRRAPVRWLKSRRRHLGVASFAYCLLHTLIYVERRPDLDYILEQAQTIAMWTGWLALVFMAILALTSNNYSVRRLGRVWKRIHRLAYAAAALTLLHWILSAFDPATAYVYLGVLVAIELARLWKWYFTPSRPIANPGQ